MHVLLASVLSLLLQSSSPTVKPEHPVINDGRGGTKAHITQSQEAYAPSPSPARGANEPSTPKPQASSQDSDHANNGIQRVKIVSQPEPQDSYAFLVYVGLTALAMIINAAILLAIVRQNKINWRQVRINVRAARAARTGARAASMSAGVARETANAFKNAERPWIVVTLKEGIKDGSFREKGDGTYENLLYFEWFLTNFGRTPALVYEVRAYLEIKTWEEIDMLRQNGVDGKPLRPDKFIVTPQQVHDCPGITKINYWTDAERASVMKRNAFLVAHGGIKYRNVLEGSEIHETPFIGVYVFLDGGYREFLEGHFRLIYDAPAFNTYS
jgi:hypothetical protein